LAIITGTIDQNIEFLIAKLLRSIDNGILISEINFKHFGSCSDKL